MIPVWGPWTVAELGETQDPRQLVPGKPEAIDENVRVLRARGDRANQAGEGLLAIDTGAWQGPAAREFQDKFSYEPGKWFGAADALSGAADVLAQYADTLRWAQSQAVEAIDLWNRGQAATQQARAEHDTAVAQATANNQAAPPFTDPGESSRQAARDVLNRARSQLNEAGDS
jgi:type VII secretion system ESX-1 substrate